MKLLFFTIKQLLYGIIFCLDGQCGLARPEDLQSKYSKLLTDGEAVEIDFKLIRDVFIFINKRLILVDKQGLTGKKIKYLSISYCSISRFSLDTAGHFHLRDLRKSNHHTRSQHLF